MKKVSLVAFSLLSATLAAHASVTLGLDSGVLRTPTGTPLTSGLLQLIAYRSSTGVFAVPTANSFVGGDTSNELVVASFSFNQGGTGYATGESSNVVNFLYESTTSQNSTTTFDPGDELLLRWYPTLTLGATAPGANVTYGQYRSSATPDGGIAYFGPADGTTLGVTAGLNFLTSTAGGSNNDLLGYASLRTAAVPEPSSFMLIGGAVTGLLSLGKLRRKS